MPAQLSFYPLGNADTSLIRLTNDQLILIDYANMGDEKDKDDLRCNLPLELRRALSEADKNDFDVVCFTHLDDDHVKGASDFFWFNSVRETQQQGRPKIKELWVPASAVTEVGTKGEARRIRQEARERFLKGENIKVFSRPEALIDFLAEHNLTLEDRRNCIVNAGETISGFSLNGDSCAEFFIHCPFAWRIDDREIEDRNQDSVVLQVTLRESDNDTYAIFGADMDAETLSQIVATTKRHKKEPRLQWDLLHLFHHCSWKALCFEKPVSSIQPAPEIKWLLETQGREGSIIVSPSKPIPLPNTPEDEDPQPPHRLAANYYKKLMQEKNGQFIVTMEYPKIKAPSVIKFEVTPFGIRRKAIIETATMEAANSNQRAGS